MESQLVSPGQRLARFLFTYRNTPHTVTERTPAELFLKRQPRTRLSLIKPDVSDVVSKHQLQQQKVYDKKSKSLRTFSLGERVLVRERPSKSSGQQSERISDDFFDDLPKYYNTNLIWLRISPLLFPPVQVTLAQSKKFEEVVDLSNSFLVNDPDSVESVLSITPDPDLAVALQVDAGATGAGAVLLQEDETHIEHPLSYFSRKFSKTQKNYSVIEKEALALLLALQHFEV
ncbi:hypothetical protein QQF64_020320 [Cirrhinus molitorella]|uniref:Reverse transcriptase/retrotransposon-derived protein RNase H-like domain-containing protein n=1 Tax=Cirrhinus molitorella TaxID=172907 RepID=A0ABR3LAD9_9TELE